ncbi:MAG: right-handed parallel beta-helix repeat-containing protein [Planctomycetia bacterium]|nr:right-handed parallel beta-helix repeat-containing protein [Planctomycetia bacterium]
MKLLRIISLFLFLVFFSVTGIKAMSVAEFHVSVNTGSDENPGTLEAPFATLQKARDVARTVNRDDAEVVTIYVHPGDYYLSETVAFGEEDHDLLICGWNNGKNLDLPRFFGGIQVKDWKKSDFRGLENVYEADLATLGVKNRFRQLFYDGKRQIWCRYPNYDVRYPFSGGWAYVDGKIFNMYTDVPGERCDLVQIKEEDFRNWEKPEEGMICLFPRYNWWNVALGIKESDPEKRTLTLEKPMGYAARPADRYHVMGFREELDVPGEWYQDVEAQKLYFIPPDDKLMETSVTIPVPEGIFSLKSCKHVTFRGLDLCGAEKYGVKMDWCENCVVEKSLLHDMVFFSGAPVSIAGGWHCQVLGCNIWNSGGHGVEINHSGDRKAFRKAEHNIENNYIHHCGQMYRHGIGVIVHGIGCRIAHNRIHDMPRCGIFHGGQLNTIEYNDISFTNLEMEDTGAIYGGGWTGGLGTVIRYNRCTDSIGFGHDSAGKYHFYMFAWGIYLDEANVGTDVYGNIVERCQIGAMHLHNARENHIMNNIFVSNAGKKGKARQMSYQGWDNNPDGVFLRDRQPKQLKSHNDLVNSHPEWGKMRGMHVSPADPFLPDGTMMRGNRVERNIYYYPDQPESLYVSASAFNLEYNKVDKNIVYAGGAPIRTNQKSVAVIKLTDGAPKPLTGRVKNVDFSESVSLEEQAKNPSLTPAVGWTWYQKTYPEIHSEIVKNGERMESGKDVNHGENGGKDADGDSTESHALRIYAAYNAEKPYIKNSCIRSAPFSLEPGKDYLVRFRARLSEDATEGGYMRVVTENKGLWKAFGSKTFKEKEQICEVGFHFPAEGEPEYDARIGDLTLHFQMSAKIGWFEISDIEIFEAEMLSEWDAWQRLGGDVNSLTEDPQFVAPEQGDYRLKPTSPALKLGFEPIPFEKIGPYSSEKRVTWPIREAEGVRQHPEWLEIPGEE